MRLLGARSARAFVSLSAVLVGLVAVALLVWTGVEGQEAVRQALRAARPWLLLWRLAVLGVLIARWDSIVESLSRRFRLSSVSAHTLRRWRWRAALWLIVMDLVLVEDVRGLLARVV